MNKISKIKDKLQSLNPIELKIIDDSEKHRGHAGYNANGMSHVRILIVSEEFLNLSLLERHRMVNNLLSDEFSAGLHSLVIKAYTPKEYSK